MKRVPHSSREVWNKYQELHRSGLSGADLKRIAMFCMLIDHIGCALLEPLIGIPGSEPLIHLNWLCRRIGRIAFPIYSFLLAEGYRHTRKKGKYLLRLAGFGLASEIPYDLAFMGRSVDWESQNVLFTLFLGLLTLVLMGRIRNSFGKYRALKHVLLTVICIAAADLAQFIQCDYGAAGVLIIVTMDLLRNTKSLRNLTCEVLLLSLHPMELTACLSFPLLNCYNDTRGSQSKQRMYMFYPGHLILLCAIRFIITRS